MKLRTTERRCFKRCRRKWDFRYIDQLVPVRTSSPLFVGSAVHEALEGFYKQPAIFDPTGGFAALDHFLEEARISAGVVNMEPEQRDEWQADEELAKGMADHYFDWAPYNDDFRMLEVEIFAEIPLNRQTSLTLRADGYALKEDGTYWLVEHKTTSTIEQDSVWLELDDQASTYTWAFWQLAHGHGKVRVDDVNVPVRDSGREYHPISGIIYNLLLKSVPHEVVLNQNGAPSRGSKNMSCKVADYEQALKDWSGERTPEYEDMLTKLEAKRWFHRLPVYRATPELASFEEDVWGEIEAMRAARNRPSLRFRTPTRDCNWDCEFFDLCKGELEGLDTSYMKSELFTVETE